MYFMFQQQQICYHKIISFYTILDNQILFQKCILEINLKCKWAVDKVPGFEVQSLIIPIQIRSQSPKLSFVNSHDLQSGIAFGWGD